MPETQGPDVSRLQRTLVLVGMPGSGKTAIGRALSARLGVAMRDSDAAIVERARLSIAEIFERYGEAFFREREGQVIASLLGGPPTVLSTGGGAWLSAANRARIAAQAAVVWLQADHELLWSRVRHRTTRPLLMTDDPKATLAALQAEREPVYAKAEFTLQVRPEWSILATTDALEALLTDAGVVVPQRQDR
ncbi:MAG: shikimate kinase [Pseudomonadota bacterium]